MRCVGKGPKERCTPLAKTTVAVLKAWLHEPPKHSTEVLIPQRCVAVASARIVLQTCWPNTWHSLASLARLSRKST